MKTWLVIRREYWTRVRKKSFILITLLVPLLIIVFYGAVFYISTIDTGSHKVGVIDQNKWISEQLTSNSNMQYIMLNDMSLESAREIDTLDGILHIPAFDPFTEQTIDLYSEKQLGMGAKTKIQTDVNSIVINKKIQLSQVDTNTINSIQKNNVKVRAIDKSGTESSNELASGIGMASGFLLYMFMFFYGFNVMRSVMEEKTNRIAEIIVSSVKPFQLMLGKIIGVAMVGLTQFLIWIVVLTLLYTFALPILLVSGATPDATALQEMSKSMMTQDTQVINEFMKPEVINVIMSANWIAIICWFVFYFLSGYFLYASLFAAIGSLVNEDEQEGQSLTFPVTLPIIVGLVILISTIKNPHSNLAVFGSIFPFTSPIVMMGRIPYGISGNMVWQLGLSVILIIVTFILTTMLAAKIYRTGILLYGKKITLKEVGKWIFRKS